VKMAEPNIYMVLADSIGVSIPVLFVILIWSLVWTAIALWKSARHKQLYWFIAMLVLNTAGILPIVYIVFFQKKKKKS